MICVVDSELISQNSMLQQKFRDNSKKPHSAELLKHRRIKGLLKIELLIEKGISFALQL